jgi:hypothetical protein
MKLKFFTKKCNILIKNINRKTDNINSFQFLMIILLTFVYIKLIHNRLYVYNYALLLVILYKCGTSSLTLGEEHRLKVFKNRMLKRMCGPQREKVAGGWKRLYNEELHICILHQI